VRDLFSHTYVLISKECIELIEENFGPRSKNDGD
jgi:hypothetical protein